MKYQYTLSFVWFVLLLHSCSCIRGLLHSYPLQCLPADGLKGKTLSSDAQSRFVELLLYIPILEFAELKQLAALLRTGSLNSSAAQYLLHLVDQRWEHLVHSGCNSVQFSRLLFSSVVDHTTAADCRNIWFNVSLGDAKFDIHTFNPCTECSRA